MKVTFLLPGPGRQPMGGYKVVYEYANALVGRGHEVTVVHPAFLPLDPPRGPNALAEASRYIVKGALGWRPQAWFAIDPRVSLVWAPSLREKWIPDGDAIVATWWQTAEMLAQYSPRKGRKFYLIQHFESWRGPEERVLATWRLPLTRIVIARWLAEIANRLNETSHYIPNGLNFKSFGVDVDPTHRGLVAAMLHNELAWKGSKEGLEAIKLAKAQVPELRAELFGVGRKPVGLPEWIRYQENPKQAELRAIYNRAAIFVSPSWAEGWPLPPAEALMCGCALVCTDIGGHREYAIDHDTALLGPVKDPDALAARIVRLANDADLRLRLSSNGNRFIQQFTWERAVAALESVLVSGQG